MYNQHKGSEGVPRGTLLSRLHELEGLVIKKTHYNDLYLKAQALPEYDTIIVEFLDELQKEIDNLIDLTNDDYAT